MKASSSVSTSPERAWAFLQTLIMHQKRRVMTPLVAAPLALARMSEWNYIFTERDDKSSVFLVRKSKRADQKGPSLLVFGPRVLCLDTKRDSNIATWSHATIVPIAPKISANGLELLRLRSLEAPSHADILETRRQEDEVSHMIVEVLSQLMKLGLELDAMVDNSDKKEPPCVEHSSGDPVQAVYLNNEFVTIKLHRVDGSHPAHYVRALLSHLSMLLMALQMPDLVKDLLQSKMKVFVNTVYLMLAIRGFLDMEMTLADFVAAWRILCDSGSVIPNESVLKSNLQRMDKSSLVYVADNLLIFPKRVPLYLDEARSNWMTKLGVFIKTSPFKVMLLHRLIHHCHIYGAPMSERDMLDCSNPGEFQPIRSSYAILQYRLCQNHPEYRGIADAWFRMMRLAGIDVGPCLTYTNNANFGTSCNPAFIDNFRIPPALCMSRFNLVGDGTTAAQSDLLKPSTSAQLDQPIPSTSAQLDQPIPSTSAQFGKHVEGSPTRRKHPKRPMMYIKTSKSKRLSILPDESHMKLNCQAPTSPQIASNQQADSTARASAAWSPKQAPTSEVATCANAASTSIGGPVRDALEVKLVSVAGSSENEPVNYSLRQAESTSHEQSGLEPAEHHRDKTTVVKVKWQEANRTRETTAAELMTLY